jgi:ASPIC/UnbV protein/VCBS repeat protein
LAPASVMRIPIVGSICRLIDREGEAFFRSGQMLVGFLNRMGRALRQNNSGELKHLYDESFSGRRLGIIDLSPISERDGVQRAEFRPVGGDIDRQTAIEEWLTYISGFDQIDDLSLHLYRIEEWRKSSQLLASVRFELIGTRHRGKTSGIDRAYFRMAWQTHDGVLQICDQSLIEGERIVCREAHFQEVSRAAGIDFVNQYYPPFLTQPLKFGMIRYGPGGISVVDYDNDGFYDLFIPDGASSRLFRNRRDGTFEDVTHQSGLGALDGVSVATFADYDNDGHKDLFVSRTFQPNQLFHNNGDGTFTDVTRESGIGEDCCTTVAGWADYDNDGFLDLYVGRYLDPRKDIPTTFYARNGEPNQLYHNNGDGTFTNVTQRAGVGDRGLCLGLVWGDFDDNGFPDLYVVNDFGRKTLYQNNGDGTFSDVTVKSNTLAYGAGMSASFVDYNNDGRFDYYVTHIRSEHSWFAESPTVKRYILKCMTQGTWKTDMPLYWQIFKQSGRDFVRVFQQMASGNTLLQNKGNGTFEDVTGKAHANPSGWFWGASFADFDNDGWQDLYLANGWVYNDRDTEIELEFLNNVVTNQNVYKTGLYFDPKYFGRSSWHGWERNRYLHNNGDGTFLELGHATGTDLILNSRGVAVADFWNRGVMDIAVSASADRHALFKNEVGLKRNWLQVELVGRSSNRDAVGVRVTLYAGGKPQSREVVLGDGYGSQNSLRQHFGLDHHPVVDKLVVRWPTSGTVQTFEQVAANQIVEVTEGNNRLVPKTYPAVANGAHAAVPA